MLDFTSSEEKQDPQEHKVQFYESDRNLIQTQVKWIREALQANDACVVIATKQHRESFQAELRDLSSNGRLIFLDASRVLSKFFLKNQLDEDRFQSVIQEIIERAAKK